MIPFCVCKGGGREDWTGVRTREKVPEQVGGAERGRSTFYPPVLSAPVSLSPSSSKTSKANATLDKQPCKKAAKQDKQAREALKVKSQTAIVSFYSPTTTYTKQKALFL